MEKTGENVKIIKLAVTGNIASGKSTVCRILEEHGAYVVDADVVVHGLISSDSTCIQEIIRCLGTGVVIGGKLSRERIAQIVFSDQAKLRTLEAILHPRVQQAITEEYEKIRTTALYNMFVAEVSLLYETNMETFFDCVLAVLADRAQCRQRWIEKGLAKAEFNKRISNQLSEWEILQKADFVIYNSGSLETLEQKVKQIITAITS